MSAERSPEGRVYEKSGIGVAGFRATGDRRYLVLKWVEQKIPRRRGRPPDPRVAEWAARIESADYEELGLDSLCTKCCQLAFEGLCEDGRDPDLITKPEIVKLAKARYAALSRFHKKRGLIL